VLLVDIEISINGSVLPDAAARQASMNFLGYFVFTISGTGRSLSADDRLPSKKSPLKEIEPLLTHHVASSSRLGALR